MSNRKPHNDDAGYVCELVSKHPRLPGHIVIYDRKNGAEWIDADERWIVMHQPTTHHISVRSLRTARALMKAVANGSDVVDIGQNEGASA